MAPSDRPAEPSRPADGAEPEDADDGLPSVHDEPEPPWVEDIRRRRRARAERLKELLADEPAEGEPAG